VPGGWPDLRDEPDDSAELRAKAEVIERRLVIDTAWSAGSGSPRFARTASATHDHGRRHQRVSSASNTVMFVSNEAA
jgi:hypothetical protein